MWNEFLNFPISFARHAASRLSIARYAAQYILKMFYQAPAALISYTKIGPGTAGLTVKRYTHSRTWINVLPTGKKPMSGKFSGAFEGNSDSCHRQNMQCDVRDACVIVFSGIILYAVFFDVNLSSRLSKFDCPEKFS
jgi:hypothetical protein